MRAGRSLLLGIVLSLGALVAAPRAARAQQVAVRFEITEASDSTFTFGVGPQRWVSQRSRGIVVDPAKRDALVARFRILNIRDGVVTALVTGQTSQVTTQHFVVMDPPPPPPWHKRSAVWTGTAIGAVLGFVLGAAIR